MKIHCARFHDSHEGWMLRWFTNKSEAQRHLNENRGDGLSNHVIEKR